MNNLTLKSHLVTLTENSSKPIKICADISKIDNNHVYFFII